MDKSAFWMICEAVKRLDDITEEVGVAEGWGNGKGLTVHSQVGGVTALDLKWLQASHWYIPASCL